MFNSPVERKIGNDYKERWKAYRKQEEKSADRIFIDAPTGSGKTTFILQRLLPYYSRTERKILYLVNRRILKEQIREMIADLPHAQYGAIRVELYQEIEKRIVSVPMQYRKTDLLREKEREEEQEQSEHSTQYNKTDSVQGYDYSFLKKLSEYDCVVCDEAHYFLTDSTYNTNTVFSFRWIQDVFRNKVCIFMSATIHELKSYMETKNLYDYGESNTAYYGIAVYDPSVAMLNNRIARLKEETCRKLNDHEVITYSVNRDYSYISANNIRIIYNRKALVDLVAEGNHKWLIFVDNIKYGNALRNSIKKKLKKHKNGDSSESMERDVILLSSGYKRDQEATDEVDRIIRTQASSAKVLIVTAVLDNGVNIKDLDVRNVVLFADTETEFIQMLGRKRKDAQQFKLYIYGYDKNHFSKRKRQLRKQKEIADRYLRDIEEVIDKLTLENSNESWNDKKNQDRLNEWERACIEDQHEKIMREIYDNYNGYENVRCSFTVYDGKWHLNLLSFENIQKLVCYFNNMIRKFDEEGEDAFAREQLRWLGKTGETAEDIIRESKLADEKESRKRVTAALREIAGKKMIREEYKKLTDEMLTDLRVVVAHPVDFPSEMERTNEQFEKWNTIKREFSKAGKVLSKQSMEFLRTYCRIPFQLDNDRKGGYMVRFVNQEGEDV